MSQITTVIFDMYETLAQNNTALWLETFRGICRDQDLKIDPELLYLKWKSLEVGFRKERLNLEEPEMSPPFRSYEETWSGCFKDVFSTWRLDNGDAEAAAKDAIRHMGLREPYPDALEALPVIQARWRTGVLSNADDGYLYPLLSRLGWKFEAVLSSEEARAYKPAPSPFKQVMDKLGVEDPTEVMYVGDALFDDVRGAKGVGMRVAWVNRNGASADPQSPKPDHEVRSLTELPGILEAVS